MQKLPRNPDLDHLKRQAKELLAAVRAGDSDARARFAAHLPSLRGHMPDTTAARALRLHDAQSCIARSYGFASWDALRSHVDVARFRASDPASQRRAFAVRAYPGDIIGNMNRARPAEAERLLSAVPDLAAREPAFAPTIGDTGEVRRQIAQDPDWVHRPAGPLNLPPLVAATHSGFLRLEAYRAALYETVDLLLAAGADPNQSVGSRWPPASVADPSEEHRMSALYGAAGQHHDARLTETLLAAGADPDDGESLYHAIEAEDPACLRLLLDAGATIKGTNAIYHALDYEARAPLALLLASAGEAGAEDGLLLWAIRRRRSTAHIEMLLKAGVDPAATAEDGMSAYAKALRYGLPEVARILEEAGARTDLSAADKFIAACACGDRAAASALLAQAPDLIASLDVDALQMLPELAAAGCGDAVRTMVELGWPVDTLGGDWTASVINHAVFRGDGALTEFLLARGAVWTETHGFGDNACGTLSWASLNRPVEGGNWVECAQALVAHGMPPAVPNPADPETVLVGGEVRQFSDEVTQVLLSSSLAARAP
ncbi:MAG: hypothetical protein AAGB05_06795 [Pseudomonadota bacterium]